VIASLIFIEDLDHKIFKNNEVIELH